MTREEMDFIGSMNMCDEISNEAYQKIMTHCEEQGPCNDCISRHALRQKLQEHHDFFINAYGSFKDMPLNDKARVDEISSCIAEVVNAPSVTPQPKTGHWIEQEGYDGDVYYDCSECGESFCLIDGTPADNLYKYCPSCGAKMEVET